MFGAIRGALGRGAAAAGRYGMRNAGTGGLRGAAGLGSTAGSSVLGYASRMSNLGLSTAGGAIAGGIYGAASDNTSILGGMMMGAGLGAGAYGASRLGRMGLAAYTAGGGGRAGAKQAAWAMGGLARSSIANFGARLRSNTAINKISGFASGIAGRASAFRAGRVSEQLSLFGATDAQRVARRAAERQARAGEQVGLNFDYSKKSVRLMRDPMVRKKPASPVWNWRGM